MISTVRLPFVAVLSVGLVATSFTTGCTDRPYSSPQEQAQNACQAFGPKTLSGALIGGLGGAAGGAGIGALAGGGKGAAIGAGVGLLTGLIAGSITGNQLDKRDCQEAQMALAQIRYKQIGQPTFWTNQQTGSHGSYTPISAEMTAQNGQMCRRIRQDSQLHDRQATTQTLITCRTANGDYQTVQPLPVG